jgi:hypothetical protein
MISSIFWDVTQPSVVVTDISAEPVGPIFNVQGKALEVGTGRLSLNVGIYCSGLRNIPTDDHFLKAVMSSIRL